MARTPSPWPVADHGLEVVALGYDGGDSFLAGLVVGLRAGLAPEEAGGLAAACAASTVARLGGLPDLRALRPG